jgi:AAA+ superfamily predicted ATPase
MNIKLDRLDDLDEDEQEGYLATYVHWTTSDGRVFVPAAATQKTLTPGVYEIDQSSSIGLYFEKIPVRSEGLIRFPDTNSDKVVSEIQKFWEREDIFNEYELTYKRGILLYGPPGSGKSCTIQLIMQDVVERQGIVIKFTEPRLFVDGIRVLRQVQPETPVVVIMEDIDSILDMYNESEVLNILDGVNQANKVVFLATTNYPEKLGARIVNRPSRFDKRFRIGFPSKASRRMYFEHLIGGGDKEILDEKISDLKLDLDRWVKDTDEMSVAHLKELFVQVVIIGDDYEDAIKTLQSMTENLEDKEFDGSIGFGNPSKSKDYYD